MKKKLKTPRALILLIATAVGVITLTACDTMVRISEVFECNVLANYIAQYLNVDVDALVPASRKDEVRLIFLEDENARSLSGVEYLDNLTFVVLVNTQISNLQPLGSAEKLEFLQLENNRHRLEIPTIRSLTTLLATDSLIFPPHLPNLRGLTRLELINSIRVMDLSLIENLTKLTTLAVVNNDSLLSLNINALDRLRNLQSLNLSGNNINDIRPLAELRSLRQLNLQDNNINDIRPLAELNNLVELNLQDNDVTLSSPLVRLANLQKLNLQNNNISFFDSLAELRNLQELNLQDNNISRINYFDASSNLQQLNLQGNNISDISTLSGYRNLQQLNLQGNNISDIAVLNEFRELQELNLQDNNISDIRPLSGLQKLTDINLQNNVIGEIPRVGEIPDFPALTTLNLSNNPLSHIGIFQTSRLLRVLNANNTKITDFLQFAQILSAQLEELYLANDDPDSDYRILSMSSPVWNTNLRVLDLTNNAIDNISFLTSHPRITHIHLRGNQIIDIFILSTLNTLVMADLAYNQIIDLRPLNLRPPGATNITTFDASWQTFHLPPTAVETPTQLNLFLPNGEVPTFATNQYFTFSDAKLVWHHMGQRTLSFQHISPNESFAFSGHVYQEVGYQNPIFLADIFNCPNLINAVADRLNLSHPTDVLGKARLEEVEELVFVGYGNGVTDVTGIDYLVNLHTFEHYEPVVVSLDFLARLPKLTNLRLDGGGIQDIAPLRYLTGLRYLSLAFNEISNIGALYPLVDLETLNLSFNKVSNIGALAPLVKLEYLNLEGNAISNVAALSTLVKLETLNLEGNAISNVAALSTLVKLETLNLEGNAISNVAALSALVELETLNLEGNTISDIDALSALVELATLNLEGNTISDIDALSALVELETLNLNFNEISDIAAVSNLENLAMLYLQGNAISDLRPAKELPLIRLYAQHQSITLADVAIGEVSQFLLKNQVGEAGTLVRSVGEFVFENTNLMWLSSGRNEATWENTTDVVSFSGTIYQNVLQIISDDAWLLTDEELFETLVGEDLPALPLDDNLFETLIDEDAPESLTDDNEIVASKAATTEVITAKDLKEKHE